MNGFLRFLGFFTLFVIACFILVTIIPGLAFIATFIVTYWLLGWALFGFGMVVLCLLMHYSK